MRDLPSWFRRAAHRAEKTIRLEDALLGGRFFPYALHRLRFFGLRSLLAALLQAAKIFLAFRFFLPGRFAAILIVESAVSLATGFWWGSLEVLRERVRELAASGRPAEMAAEIGRWLSWSLRLSLWVCGAGLLWTLSRALGRGPSFGPADLFLLAVVIRFSLDLVGRCFHSGVFAVRRVYRPLAVIVFVELAGFGLALGFWPVIGAWALPAASLVSTFCASGMVFYYAGRAYRRLGIAPRLGKSRRPRGAGTGDWLAAGTAYALMRIDALVALAAYASAGAKGSPLAALALAMGPLLRAASEWTQLFYFDLKRLDADLLNALREAFEKKLQEISAPIGLLTGVAAAGLARLFFGRWLGFVQVPLLILFAARSALAARQMRAFSARRYGELWIAGSTLIAGWGLAGALIGDPFLLLTAGTVVVAVASVWLGRKRPGRDGPRSKPGRLLALPDWIRAARCAEEPITVFAVQFSPGSIHRGRDDPRAYAESDRWAHRRIAEAAALKLGPGGRAAPAGPARFVWFEKAGGRALDKPWLLAHGGGLIRKLGFSGPPEQGERAIRAAWEGGFFGPRPAAGGPNGPPTTAGVRKEFSSRFPGGIVFAPGDAIPHFLDRLPSPERSAIYADALRFASEFSSVRPVSRFDVTSFVEGGAIRLIFVLGRGAAPSLQAHWRARIRRLNFEGSCGGTTRSFTQFRG